MKGKNNRLCNIVWAKMDTGDDACDGDDVVGDDGDGDGGLLLMTDMMDG